MPVTQPKRELKPTETVHSSKTAKVVKHAVKLHAPGFTSAPALVASPEVASDPETENLSLQEPAKKLPTSRRLLKKSRYTYSNPYSEFFVGGPAFPYKEQIPLLNNTYLRPNAKFVGEQHSGCSRYEIKVEIKAVDLLSSVVTGFFQISGLTDEHPLITTCFKGEIINNPLHRMDWGNSAVQPKRYSFITEETNWSSFPKNDLEHWKKLTGCPSHYSEQDLRERLARIQSGAQDSLYIYMRWKEEFLLPDSRVKLLAGASFEGFYYVVLNIGSGPLDLHSELFSSLIIPGTMSGLYFYTQSEKFQSLSLRYVEDRGVSHSYEFA